MATSTPFTATDIINAAFRVMGVTAKSETPTADEQSDALMALNLMIDSWNARGLMSLALIRENFSLTYNKQSYTIGSSGADFTTTTPIKIVNAFYQDSANNVYPLEVVTREEFISFTDRNLVTAPPNSLYYDPGATQQATQKGTIYLYFTPDNSTTYTLYIDSQKPFTEFAAVGTTVTFPPAYLEALKWNLALNLYPEYHGPASIPPLISAKAIETMEELEAVNSTTILAGLDLPRGKGGSFNWVSGEAS